MRRALSFVVAVFLCLGLHVVLSAQQGGLNTSVLPGLPEDPLDPLAPFKSDILEQRQVEADIFVSTRNHLHVMAFFNDYRGVHLPGDAGPAGQFAHRGLRGWIDRILAWFSGRPAKRDLPAHAAAVEARVGFSRSYDGGLTWHGGLLPKIDGLDGETDPKAAGAPCGIGYAVLIAFTRNAESKVVVWKFQDDNDLDGGDTWRSLGYSIVESANNAENGPFHDLPAIAVDPLRTPGADPCAHRVYVGWARFTGAGGATALNFASTTAGGGPTWNPVWDKKYIKTPDTKTDQGVALTVDPRPGTPSSTGGGTLYYVWRAFESAANPNAIWMTSSTDFGATFAKGTQVTSSTMYPFDQPTISTIDAGNNAELLAFRSNALPTTQVVPKPTGGANLFIAWQERVSFQGCPTLPGEPIDPASNCGIPSAVGEPRIVLTKSADRGATWTDYLGAAGKRRAVDFADRDTTLPTPGFGYLPMERSSGGQIMPRLSLGGGRFGLLYYEGRGALTAIGAGLLAGINRQLDARYALLDPATGSLLGTAQVSRYPVKQGANLSDGESEEDIAEVVPGFQRINKRVNAPNSSNGTAAFIGDFIGASPVVQFVFNPAAGLWKWALSLGDVPFQGFRTVFADSRNQGPPAGAIPPTPTDPGDPKLGGYPNFVPPGSAPPLPACDNQHTRNHDVIHVLVDASVAVNAISSFKQLAQTVERAFPITVTNGTNTLKGFKETSDKPGIFSFDQFAPTPDELKVILFPYSSATRVAYVASSIPNDSVTVTVTEVMVTCTDPNDPSTCTASDTPVPNGLTGKVTLNLDPTNPVDATADPTNPNNFTDKHTPLVSNPLVSNLNPSTPLVSNDALNPLVSNPLVSNKSLNPLVSNPLVSNPSLPEGTTVYNIIDTTWKVTGSPDGVATAVSAAVNVANAQALTGSYAFQLLIHKTSTYGGSVGCDAGNTVQDQIISSIPNPLVSNPLVSNPLVSNPLVSNPLVSNSTFALAPPAEGTGGPSALAASATTQVATPDDEMQLDFKGDADFVTLRAYQLVQNPPVVFNPEVEPPAIAVFSQSVDVVGGVEQGDSIDDAPSAFAGPDLIVDGALAVSPATVAAGGTVLFPVEGWAVRNIGTTPAAAPFSHGYYLSTDAEIDPAEDVLLGTELTTISLPVEGSQTFGERTLTIPIGTAAGDYFIGIFVDRNRDLSEGRADNNFAAVPLTVTGAAATIPGGEIIVADGSPSGGGALLRYSSSGLFNGAIASFADECPQDAVIGPSGDFFVVDACTNKVMRVTPAGAVTTLFSGEPLQNPVAIALDADGNIIIGDNVADKLFKLDGETMVEFASLPGPSPTLAQDIQLALDRTGNVVVAYDNFNGAFISSNASGAIARVAPDGVVTLLTSGRPFSAGGLALNAAGNFVIADFFNKQIIEVTPAGVITTVISDATGLCCNLVGLAIDSAGRFVSTTNGVGDVDEDPPQLLRVTPPNIAVLASGEPLTNTNEVVIYPSTGTDLVVTNTNDAGAGSLRNAIQTANANAGLDTITFDIDGAAPHVIALASGLPTITDPVVIDGTSQPGFFGTPVIVLDGAGAGTPGLSITAGSSVVRGLAIGNFSGNGIELLVGGGNLIQGNYIGTDASGAVDQGNGGNGIQIVDSPKNRIGGITAAARNVVAGNGGEGIRIDGAASTGNLIQGNFIGTSASGAADLGNTNSGVYIRRAPGNSVIGNLVSGNDGFAGVAICGNLVFCGGGVGPGTNNASGNVVQGNLIGTDATGVAALGNGGFGVSIDGAPNTLVGGAVAAARNVISANGSHGVVIFAPGANGNRILGNAIGTDVSGTLDRGNALNGVSIDFGSNNVVGGSAAGEGNLISGNGQTGLLIASTASQSFVRGNRVGTNAAGTAAIGNLRGVVLAGPDNTVGGTTAGAGNQISGNGGQGIGVAGATATGNSIQGNLIGTNAAGTAALANGSEGILIGDSASGNTVGGPSPAARNIISGNGNNGVVLRGASNNFVQGNYIGTDINGTAAVGNSTGVLIEFDADNNTIGGSLAGETNLIAGNSFYGVVLGTPGPTGNIVRGNQIGKAGLGNGSHGVIINGADDNTVSGNDADRTAPNEIRFNGGAGIVVLAGTGNKLRVNRIDSNAGLAIDLAPIGVTPNDAGDGDAGANGLQNMPVLSAVTTSDGVVTTQGTLNSTPNTTFTIDLFVSDVSDPSGFGEGSQWFGATTVTTNGAGNASFIVGIGGGPAAAGQVVTALATVGDFVGAFSGEGSTSEFSGARVVVPPGFADFAVSEGGNGHVYEYVVSPGRWTAARTAAEGRSFRGVSGHLVTIGSAAENAVVSTFRAGGDLRAWIGLTDAASEGTFTWVTGEGLVYTNWNAGEPNNQLGIEHFVEIFAAGVWNDIDDQGLGAAGEVVNQGYLVEYPVNPATPRP